MLVKIYFGPYEAHGLIKHRIPKMYGVLTQLTKLGYEIEIIPTKRLNSLILHLQDKEIFRCDLRYLKFNMDFEEDAVAQILVNALEETKKRFDSEDNLPKFEMTKKSLRKNEALEYVLEDIQLLFENGNKVNGQ